MAVSRWQFYDYICRNLTPCHRGSVGWFFPSTTTVASKQDGGWRKVDVGRWMKQTDEEKKEGVIRMVRKRWRGVAPYFYTVWPLLCIIPHLARSSRDADSRYADLSSALKTRTYRAFRRSDEWWTTSGAREERDYRGTHSCGSFPRRRKRRSRRRMCSGTTSELRDDLSIAYCIKW